MTFGSPPQRGFEEPCAFEALRKTPEARPRPKRIQVCDRCQRITQKGGAMRFYRSDDSLRVHRPKPIKEAGWSYRLKTEAGEQGLREVLGVPGHDHIRFK